MFHKYTHLEKLGNEEVEGITLGWCYIFTKLDGTNASVWLDGNEIKAGSRNRELTLEKDNAGFLAHITQDERIQRYLTAHPDHRLFGEWLVPHTIKNYRIDAWNKFYIFDVAVQERDDLRYLPYEEYQYGLSEHGLDYLPPLRIIKNPTQEDFMHLLEQNTFLMQEGTGTGEGLVVKNYNYLNKYQRRAYAKIVTSEFKEKHYKTMGSPEKENRLLEEDIAEQFCTPALVLKEHAKIVTAEGGWSSKLIPRLLQTVYYELVKEEIWEILKTFKHPQINFKTLQQVTIRRIKSLMPELF